MTWSYWDWRIPDRKPSKKRNRYKKLCENLNSNRRAPSPQEWDFIINYNYPEWKHNYDENKALGINDEIPEPVVKIKNYTKIKMFKNNREMEHWKKLHPFNSVEMDYFITVKESEAEDYK